MINQNFRPVIVLSLLAMLSTGCPAAVSDTDGGVEPEPIPTCGPNGEPCTCESEDDEWPGSLNLDALDIFADSGCTKIRGFINLTPAMLDRVSELADIDEALGLDVRGDYPSGTNLEELSFLDEVRIVSVFGATGISSLSGLDAVTDLDIGLHVEQAPDMVAIGMTNLRSVGITEPGSRVVLEEALRLVELPALETLDLPSDFALEAGPLVLQTLPQFDSDEAIALIGQFSALTDEERDPSPGRSPPSVICGLDPAVGNGADRPCEGD